MDKKTLKIMKRVLRTQRLVEEEEVGRPRAKSWGNDKSDRKIKNILNIVDPEDLEEELC
jgi:hypothetical protein